MSESSKTQWGLAKFIAELKSPASMGKDFVQLSELLFTWSIKGIYKETEQKSSHHCLHSQISD